jgi:hypothetical protein
MAFPPVPSRPLSARIPGETLRRCPRCNTVRFRTSVERGPFTLGELQAHAVRRGKNQPEIRYPSCSMKNGWRELAIFRWLFFADEHTRCWYHHINYAECLTSNCCGKYAETYVRPHALYRRLLFSLKQGRRGAKRAKVLRRTRRDLMIWSRYPLGKQVASSCVWFGRLIHCAIRISF